MIKVEVDFTELGSLTCDIRDWISTLFFFNYERMLGNYPRLLFMSKA